MKSKMTIAVSLAHGKTQLEDAYFDAPYKVMSPFWTADGTMEIMQMSSSAGMLSEDSFDLNLLVKDGARLRYVSQSYDKIFDTKDSFASKNVNIELLENAKLEYIPYPMIPFGRSDYRYRGEINIHPTAFLAYADIFTCGRTGMGEYYAMKSFDSITKVKIGGVLDFVDHTRIVPEAFNYQKMGMWGNYTHNGMLYIYTPDFNGSVIEKIRELSEQYEIMCGVSRTEKGVIVRVLGTRGDDIYNFFSESIKQIKN